MFLHSGQSKQSMSRTANPNNNMVHSLGSIMRGQLGFQLEEWRILVNSITRNKNFTVRWFGGFACPLDEGLHWLFDLSGAIGCDSGVPLHDIFISRNKELLIKIPPNHVEVSCIITIDDKSRMVESCMHLNC
jgi:hypothetical protein